MTKTVSLLVNLAFHFIFMLVMYRALEGGGGWLSIMGGVPDWPQVKKRLNFQIKSIDFFLCTTQN